MISLDDLEFRFVRSTGFSNRHHAQFVNERLGITKEVITNKKANGCFGKAVSFFFINGDDREFLSEDDLIEAYNEKFKFSEENPDYEVVYVKVIRPRDNGHS